MYVFLKRTTNDAYINLIFFGTKRTPTILFELRTSKGRLLQLQREILAEKIHFQYIYIYSQSIKLKY